MTDPVRVTAIGSGYFSQFHYDGWARMDNVQIVGMCARDREAAQALAGRYGVPAIYDDLDEMLDETRPDLLDIITPPQTHADFVKAAMDRGIHAICQKPFCPTLEEAHQAIACAKQAGKLLVVHENFRFQPWYRQIKAMLDEGALGDVYSVSFRMRPGDGQGPEAYLSRQPYFQEMPRFLVHETAIHFIDTFRYLFGDVSSVLADLRRLNPVIAGEDAGVILFRFASGVRGVYDGNRLADHIAQNRRFTMGDMLIDGSAGTLRLDGNGGLWLRAHGDNEEKPVEYDWSDRGFAGDCVYKTNRHVIEHLVKGTPLENTAAEYLTNLKIEDAVYRSSEERRWIEIA